MRRAYDIETRWLILPSGAAALLLSIVAVALSLTALIQLHERPLSTPKPLQVTRVTTSTPVAERYRPSVCFIVTSYTMIFHGILSKRRATGTGFVVANDAVATNRHVIQPWWGDDDEESLLRAGAKFRVLNIYAFFPGRPDRWTLRDPIVSSTADVALLHLASQKSGPPRPLPLADHISVIGQSVTVLGYPSGITGMLAKSLPARHELFQATNSPAVMRDLATKSLIRPVATFGRLGDVTDDRLIYDAHTAPGGSGGPVINDLGEVIGINAAFVNNFSGGNIGIPIAAIRTLLERARRTKGVQ